MCPHCGEVTNIFAEGGGEDLAREMETSFLGRLPLAPEVVTLTDQGQPLLGAAASPIVREAFETEVNNLLQRPSPAAQAPRFCPCRRPPKRVWKVAR